MCVCACIEIEEKVTSNGLDTRNRFNFL